MTSTLHVGLNKYSRTIIIGAIFYQFLSYGYGFLIFFLFSFFLAGHLSITVFILKAEKSSSYKIKVYLLTHLLTRFKFKFE